MRRYLDLHTHSHFSDGTLSPAQLVAEADALHLAAVALTDHDTIAGLAEARIAAAKFPSLRLIGGVEISAKFPHGTLHILGLGVDENAPAFRDALDLLRRRRELRNPKIIERLRQLGIDIAMDDVLAVAPAQQAETRIVGRLHIAQALQRKGAVATTQEAFEKYIGLDGPAYVDKECLTPREAIAAINAGGGVAVLAHPAHLNCRNEAQLERIVREFKSFGLGGIEAYHSDHCDTETRQYLRIARDHDLMVSGGSDFHGEAKAVVNLGRPRVPVAVVADHRFGARLLGMAGTEGK